MPDNHQQPGIGHNELTPVRPPSNDCHGLQGRFKMNTSSFFIAWSVPDPGYKGKPMICRPNPGGDS